MKRNLKQLDVPDDIASNDAQLRRYLEMVANGQTPTMAAMLASQVAPGIGVTAAIFIQDQNRHGRSILDRMNGSQQATERLRKQLARRGYTLKADDHYIPTAAAFPGDPRAVVSNTRSHVEVQEYANSLAARPPEPKIRLSKRIIDRHVEHRIKQDPGLAFKPRADLVEEIVEKHGSPAEK